MISELRAVRPNEFRRVETRRSDLSCPFCLGFEENTPPAIVEIPHSTHPHQWLIRVVPNKYPAFTQLSDQPPRETGPYQQRYSEGRQEIVIQSPRHVSSFSQLNDAELEGSLLTFQQRMLKLREEDSVEHVMLFTNCRSEAGASLEHIHSQIIGSPIISPNLETRLNRAREYYERNNETAMQSIVRWESEQASRLVTQDDSWVAFCPFASRFPYQVWIAPRTTERDFATCSSASTHALGSMIRDIVDRLERVHDFPAYNIMFHVADHRDDARLTYQWYVEIVPRLVRFAGYELGTGCWINHVSPSNAASQLRKLPSSFIEK